MHGQGLFSFLACLSRARNGPAVFSTASRETLHSFLTVGPRGLIELPVQRICTVWVPVDLPKAPERVSVGYRDRLVCNIAIGAFQSWLGKGYVGDQCRRSSVTRS